MNNKKLLIATLATAFSGISFASEEVRILPHPYPIDPIEQPKPIDFTHVSPEQLLQECKRLGIKTPEYKELKKSLKDQLETIKQTGTVDLIELTPEGRARKEACIKAVLGQIEQRKQIFTEKIDATISYIQNVAEDAKEIGRDLVEELGITDNK